MIDVSIKVNHPLIVRGLETLEDIEGNKFETGPATAHCRCGHSANKPFRDGAHKAAEFSSEPRAT